MNWNLQRENLFVLHISASAFIRRYWMRAVQDWLLWRILGEALVQQYTFLWWNDFDDDDWRRIILATLSFLTNTLRKAIIIEKLEREHWASNSRRRSSSTSRRWPEISRDSRVFLSRLYLVLRLLVLEMACGF